jgi:hypothetical protein
MTRRFLPAGLTVLLASQVASAQPRPKPAAPGDIRAQLPDDAKRAWDAAKELAGASNYKGAAVQFRQAYELSHNPRVLYNVGVAEKLQTHYARAVDAWEQELREAAGKLTTAESAEVTNAISVVQQYVSPVDVTVTEPDATLLVDEYVIGKSPFPASVRMDVGHHTLTVRKEGFVELTQPVDVAAGQKPSVTLKLEPLRKVGIVTVTASGPPSATIYLDGADVGPSPFKGQITAGNHSVEARSPGWVTVGQPFELAYKEEKSLLLTLAVEKHEGRLRVTAPEGADIVIDSRRVGTGTWEGIVSTTGSHELVVTKSGFQTYSSEVNIPDNGAAERNVDLNKIVGTSWVAWGVGSLLVVTGGIVAGYFIFKPPTASPFVGDLDPGYTTAHHAIHF